MTAYENIMVFYTLSCFRQHETLGKKHSIQQLYFCKCACVLHLFVVLAIADVKIKQSGHVVREHQVKSINWVMLPSHD